MLWLKPVGFLRKISQDSFASLWNRWVAAWRSCGSPGQRSQSWHTWQLHELHLLCLSSSQSALPAGRGFPLANTCQRKRWDALWENLRRLLINNNISLPFLPDDYIHQKHYGFIQTGKEISEGFSFWLHVAQDETKGKGEDQQTQNIHAIWGCCFWYWPKIQ